MRTGACARAHIPKGLRGSDSTEDVQGAPAQQIRRELAELREPLTAASTRQREHSQKA
ncbi:MAG: hypothetical protein WBE76_15815 [Terracidiphilus sp.]